MLTKGGMLRNLVHPGGDHRKSMQDDGSHRMKNGKMTWKRSFPGVPGGTG